MTLLPLLLQTAAPVACATPATLPSALSGWQRPQAEAGGLLAEGRAYRLVLARQGAVRFAVPPVRAAVPGAFAVARGFAVMRAGVYRVALDSGAWVDVVREGRAIAPAAHRHGPACSGIRKSVDFRLPPGGYLLQLSGARRPGATVMVARIGD